MSLPLITSAVDVTDHLAAHHVNPGLFPLICSLCFTTLSLPGVLYIYLQSIISFIRLQMTLSEKAFTFIWTNP